MYNETLTGGGGEGRGNPGASYPGPPPSDRERGRSARLPEGESARTPPGGPNLRHEGVYGPYRPKPNRKPTPRPLLDPPSREEGGEGARIPKGAQRGQPHAYDWAPTTYHVPGTEARAKPKHDMHKP